jgi:hypothetical protein
MENFQEEIEQSKEELAQEEELLKEVPVDEVRKSVIEKNGLNEDVDGELIDKLTNDTTELRKQLATAIKQKRSWREKATAKIEPKKEVETPQPSQNHNLSEGDISKKFKEMLDEEKLNAIDLDDEAKQEIKAFAKAANMPLSQALKSDFFIFKKEKYDANRKVEEAAIGGKHGSPSRQDFDINNPPEIDGTEESFARLDAWKNWRKTQ